MSASVKSQVSSGIGTATVPPRVWKNPGNLDFKIIDPSFTFEDRDPNSVGYSPNPSKIHGTILKTLEFMLKTPAEFFLNWNEFKTEDICGNQLLIMVAGAPKNVERREIIRKNWSRVIDAGSNSGFATIIFTVGIAGLTEEEVSDLKDESSIHKDIIMLNYKEMYDLLTIKTVAQMLFYYKFCENVITDFDINKKFMLHIDDDLYLDILALKDSLGPGKTIRIPDRIYCLDKALMKSDGLGTYPHRKGKYIITEREYSKERFPSACAGTAFITAYSLTKRLVDVIPDSMPVRLEDIYVTGVLRQLARVPNPIQVKPKMVEHLKGDIGLFERKISGMRDVEV